MTSKRAQHAALMSDIEAALAEHQPYLEIRFREPVAIIEGLFLLSDSEGPFENYEIQIEVHPGFPLAEPRVTETGRRIPRCWERHVYDSGACCLAVWERWLVDNADTSFAAFLKGPLRDFFLSQCVFQNTGRWPFGDRAHGTDGMLEAYSEVLGVKAKRRDVAERLELLTKPWPKGHWPCPCGSGRIIRKCHRDELWALHQRVSPRLATQMLRRLRDSVELDKKRRKSNKKHRRLSNAFIRNVLSARH
jgi:hypothetical protein